MIALDTNVLVRHLYYHDDPEQTAIANRTVNDAIADGKKVFVSAVVLAETAFTWLAARAG
jgi:predicted nucleic-acid-binding protein